MVTNRFKQLRAGKDKVSASEYNRMGKVVHAVSRSLVSHGMMDNAGITIRRSPVGSAGMILKIFEVQSVATGDGVYNCFEQTLDATEWEDTVGDDKFDDKDAVSIEVLNLFENDPEAGQHNLSTGNRLQARKWTDDEGTSRWVGIPLTDSSGGVRFAFCKVAAGATTTIVCFLDIDATGEEVTVNFDIPGGGNCDNAMPLLKDGSRITVKYDTNDSKWYCTMPLQAINTAKGLKFDTSKLAASIDTDKGIEFDGEGELSVKVNGGKGIEVDSNGVAALIDTTKGIEFASGKIAADINELHFIFSTGEISSKLDPCV